MNGTSSRKEFTALEKKYHNKLIEHVQDWQQEDVKYVHSNGVYDVEHPIPYLFSFFALTDKYVYLFNIDDYRSREKRNLYQNPFDYSEF